jgi:HEAT repeat protein
MLEQQLDLFSCRVGEVYAPSPAAGRTLRPVELDDAALIAAIPESDLAAACELATEAGRRRLAAAVSALASLCRRFVGFAARRPIPEQAAALEALAAIGGRDAADAASEMIERAVVVGPGLRIALHAAARLGSRLSQDALLPLLRHAEPSIRADACRCARPLPQLISVLIELLDDLDERVAVSAAQALGRMGRAEALGKLKSLLREHPSQDVIDAVSIIADEECVVLLGRIARSESVLAEAALTCLENVDLPRAVTVAAAIRRPRPSPNDADNDVRNSLL